MHMPENEAALRRLELKASNFEASLGTHSVSRKKKIYILLTTTKIISSHLQVRKWRSPHPPAPTSTPRHSHLSSYQFWQVSESGPPEQCYWGNSPGGQPRLHSNLPGPGEKLVKSIWKKGHSCLLNSSAQSSLI